jgi:hypothetical protein
MGKHDVDGPRPDMNDDSARMIHHEIQQNLCVWLLEGDVMERMKAILKEVKTLAMPFEELGENWTAVFRDLAERLRAAPAIEPVPDTEDGPDVGARRRIFNAWAGLFNRKTCRFRKAGKRDRAIVGRLKEFSEEEVLKSLEGFSKDPWRHEKPTRHELATLLKNAEQLETGIELLKAGGHDAGTKTGRNHGGNLTAGNRTVDYGDGDRGRESSIIDIHGNELLREAPGREPLRRGGASGDEIL